MADVYRDLIPRYKAGETAVAEDILRDLRDLTTKWTRIIRYGTGLHAEDAGMHRFLRHIYHSGGLAGARAWVRACGQRYSTEEIEQEIRLTILEVAKQAGNFMGGFPARLAANLRQLFGPFPVSLPLDEERHVAPEPERLPLLDSLPLDEMELIQALIASEYVFAEAADTLGMDRQIYRRRTLRILRKLGDEYRTTRRSRSTRPHAQVAGAAAGDD